MGVKYTTVSIPQPLAEEIEKLKPILGYRSIAEFVVEAVRRYLPQAQFQADRKLQELAKKETESIEI